MKDTKPNSMKLHLDFFAQKTHWKMSRLPNLTHVNRRVNKRHCGIEGEEKLKSVLDGGKKRPGKKKEKRNRFQSPHSTWRQEVKRKRF